MANIAIVGTGIAGMGAAWYLHREHDITVFEADERIGGHTNTVFVNEGNHAIPVDTGFIVFNDRTYPRLNALFQELGVVVKKTNMSFAAQIVHEGLEYCGSSLNKLFAQRRRIFSPRYIRFLKQLDRFNKTCGEVLTDTSLQHMSIKDYLRHRDYHNEILNWYILPMSSALWSTPPDTTAKFPVLTLVRFFTNHGFLGLNTQFQWYTVDGGSEQYKQKLIAPFRKSIQTSNAVRSVRRVAGGVEITDSKGIHSHFDKVIIATHGDQALRMWEDATDAEKAMLSPFTYQHNTATLHTDDSVMPRKKLAWSSWNYRTERIENKLVSSCTYWMNSLQDVSKNQHYFVTINDPGIVAKDKVINVIDYEHPVFTVAAMQAQSQLPALNEKGDLYFCGSYFRYGFHEDALMSAVDVCERILGRKIS
jgi:predicted NAD/FAD-binding protein